MAQGRSDLLSSVCSQVPIIVEPGLGSGGGGRIIVDISNVERQVDERRRGPLLIVPLLPHLQVGDDQKKLLQQIQL